MVMFLLLVLLGYGLRRGGVLTDETTAWLARLVALAPLPALVLSALAKASFSPTLLGAWGVAMLSVWLGMGLAWLLGNYCRWRRRPAPCSSCRAVSATRAFWARR